METFKRYFIACAAVTTFVSLGAGLLNSLDSVLVARFRTFQSELVAPAESQRPQEEASVRR